MSQEPAEPARAGKSVDDSAKACVPSASTSVQEVAGIMATLEAAPHAIASLLGSARAPRSKTEARHEAASVQATAVQPERRPSLADSIWSYAAPMLTGLCVYILAPLLVDMLKQRIQAPRHPRDAGKPAQAA